MKFDLSKKYLEFTSNKTLNQHTIKINVFLIFGLILGVLMGVSLIITLNGTAATVDNITHDTTYRLLESDNEWASAHDIAAGGIMFKRYVIKIEPKDYLIDSSTKSYVFLNHLNIDNLNGYYYTPEGRVKKIDWHKSAFVMPYFTIEPWKVKGPVFIILKNELPTLSIYKSNHQTFHKLQNRILGFLLFTLGIIFSMVMADIVLSFFLNERYFFLHGLYLVSGLLYIFASTGAGRVILGVQINNYLWAYISFLVMLIFLYSYLSIKTHFKYLTYIYYIVIAVSFMGLVLSIGGHSLFLYQLIVLLSLIIPLIGILSITLLIKKNQCISEYFVVGSICLGASIVIYVVNHHFLPHGHLFLEYIFVIGLTFESLLFTLGIMDQVRLLKKSNRLFYDIAIKDTLTGLYNRYYFELYIIKYFEQATRYEEDLSIVLLDIDYFKKINDTYGHDIGDEVLIELSELVDNFVRKSDLFVRWGGEEFIILLPKTDLFNASRLAEKLRVHIQDHVFNTIDHLTVSIGVGQWIVHEKVDELFKKVDDALYMAKSRGRNQIAANFDSKYGLKYIKKYCQWSSALETNNTLIDREHQEMMRGLRELIAFNDTSDDKKALKVFKALMETTKEHFSSEEEILQSLNYSQLSEHKHKHQELLDKQKLLKVQYTEGTINLEQVIIELFSLVVVGHLLSDDLKYYNQLN